MTPAGPIRRAAAIAASLMNLLSPDVTASRLRTCVAGSEKGRERRDVMSVRRSRRFLQLNSAVLNPSTSVTALLRFKSGCRACASRIGRTNVCPAGGLYPNERAVGGEASSLFSSAGLAMMEMVSGRPSGSAGFATPAVPVERRLRTWAAVVVISGLLAGYWTVLFALGHSQYCPFRTGRAAPRRAAPRSTCDADETVSLTCHGPCCWKALWPRVSSCTPMMSRSAVSSG